MSNKYGELIQKARIPENQNIEASPNASTGNAKKERDVNLCVKVPESLRRHWASESKRQGTSMTAAIVEALTSRFGTPE